MLMNGMFLDPETNIYEIFGQIRKEVQLTIFATILAYVRLASCLIPQLLP